MTVAAAVQPRAVTDVAPRDARIARSRPVDENRDELIAGVPGIAFESLLSLTSRVAGAAHGRGTEASAATQMFDAPAADAREQRGRAMESDFRSSFDKTPGGDRLDRSSVGARLARTAGSTDASQSPKVARGSRPTESATRTDATVASDSQTQDLNLSPSPNSDSTGDALRRGASSASGVSRGGPADQAMVARSMTPEGGAVAAAVASAATNKSGGGGSAASSNPAQQMARILATARGGGESARAIDAVPNAQGGQSANSESRTTNGSTHPEETVEGRSTESNTAGEKSSATQRTTPFDELVRSMRLNTGARRSSAKLRLDPPELGPMSVEIRIVDERAEVTVRTETPAARLIVRQRAAELTDALERRGIHLERFDVTSAPFDPQSSVFAPGDGSGNQAAGSGHQGAGTAGRSGRQDSLPGDMGAADGNGAVGTGIGVGAEPRLDIKV